MAKKIQNKRHGIASGDPYPTDADWNSSLFFISVEWTQNAGAARQAGITSQIFQAFFLTGATGPITAWRGPVCSLLFKLSAAPTMQKWLQYVGLVCQKPASTRRLAARILSRANQFLTPNLIETEKLRRPPLTFRTVPFDHQLRQMPAWR